MRLDGLRWFRLAELPAMQNALHARGAVREDQRRFVSEEGQARHAAFERPGERVRDFPIRRIPHQHAAIASRGQSRAIAVPSERLNDVLVSIQRRDDRQVLRFRIPHDHAIANARREPFSIGTERQSRRRSMSGRQRGQFVRRSQLAEFLQRSHIPSRTGLNPRFEQIDLFFRQLLLRRHVLVPRRRERRDDFARFDHFESRFTRFEREIALFLLRVVAAHALRFQQTHRLSRGHTFFLRSERSDENQRQESAKHGERRRLRA